MLRRRDGWGSGWRRGVVLGAAVALLLAARPASADLAADLAGQVSVQRISDHVAALAFPRATQVAQQQASDYIVAQLSSYGYSVSLDPVSTSWNIVVRLDGALTPDRVFVVGAHFDSVAASPGADDNASGVAGLLEIARILAGRRPDASIELVGFALEEIGKVGSTHYVDDAVAAGVDITGMIAFEMIGYTCPSPCQFPFNDQGTCLSVNPDGVTSGTYVADIGNAASATLLASFRDAAAASVPALEVTTGLVAGTGTCLAATRRSDHAPFWDHGFRALMITDTADFRNPYYHQPTDTPDTLDLVFAGRVTGAALATLVREVGFTSVFADGFESAATEAWSNTVP